MVDWASRRAAALILELAGGVLGGAEDAGQHQDHDTREHDHVRGPLPVGPGDAIAIPPGVRHTIRNTGAEELVFLCTCAPGYEHHDTFLETST